jgi:hypothetical protein
MAIMASDDDSILTEFQAENLTLALSFTSAAARRYAYDNREALRTLDATCSLTTVFRLDV